MIPLNIFAPSKTRILTYYDRCAIRLDDDEMRSVRLRITTTIQRAPVSRSRNFKYPYSKEFFGYGQAFIDNRQYLDWPVSYVYQVHWDYWNEHATIAHQLTSALQKLSEFLVATVDFEQFLYPPAEPGSNIDLSGVRVAVRQLAEGFTKESGGGLNDGNPGNDFVNTFNHPFDLIRFRFPFGTVFSVTIESWLAGNTSRGSTAGNPTTEDEYDTTNPNSLSPIPTPGSNNPANPYGDSPPPSDAIDDSLDPNDFSNAPDGNAGRGYALRVVGLVRVSGLDETDRFVDITSGCIDQPISVAFEPNPAVGFDAVSRSLTGDLLDLFITGDLLGSATLEVVRCDL